MSEEDICFLIKQKYGKEFYEDINISFKSFQKHNWDIEETLKRNKKKLFFNKKYLTPDDITYFYSVFDQYTDLIKNVFSTDHYNFLLGCNNHESFLEKEIRKRYYNIDPSYCIYVYKTYKKKYNSDKAKEKFTKKMDNILDKYEMKCSEFKGIINCFVDSYVFEKVSSDIFNKAFLNGLLITSFNFAEELIKIHIYPIHRIIWKILSKYLDLDDLDSYEYY